MDGSTTAHAGRHAEWLATRPEDVALLEGDHRALAAIREETRLHHGADDVTDDAPVYLDVVAQVRGTGGRGYAVPAHTARRLLRVRDFPDAPIATWPDDDGSTRRDELLSASAPAEGDPTGLDEIRNRTRLHHEVSDGTFPSDGEVRWFTNGLHVLGTGDDPVVYQVPMARVEEMVVPRAAPTLPWIKAPPRVA